MITKQKHKINPLPFVPEDAEYMLDHIFAKEVDGILHVWRCLNSQPQNGSWVNTNKTLTEYNDYLDYEEHEFPLSKILYESFRQAYRSTFVNTHSYSPNKYYVFKNWDEEFYVSYYKPKAKGFKGAEKRTRYGAGEVLKLDKEKYPQLEKLVGDEIVTDRPYKGV